MESDTYVPKHNANFYLNSDSPMDGTEVKNNGYRQCKIKMYLEDR